jgi:hypothetical protein
MKRARIVSRLVALLVALPVHGADKVVIQNSQLEVAFNSASASFTVRSKTNGRDFVADGKLCGSGGRAEALTSGTSRTIVIRYPNGNNDSIILAGDLPFVQFCSSLHNGNSEAIVTNHVRVVSAPLNLGKPLADLRAFGTGGLQELEKNTGSYAYLAVVDPATRAGVVGGWLTHDRGSGVVFSPVTNGTVQMEARVDYGRLRIKPGASSRTETFILGFFDDARLGLEAYADAVAKHYSIKLPPQPAGYCTWYADKHAAACDEKHIVELAEFAAKELKPFGFDFVQIDDNWQAGVSTNGPKRVFTTHRADGPYPGGMKATAANIAKLGLTPGIWFMPFAGTHYDPFFAEHQNWFATGPDGKPFETRWGGTCLDMTQPGPREYLRNLVRRIAHEWGYKIFKMDGLWTGTATRLMYVNNGYADDQIGEATLHDPDKTHIEAFRDGLKLVREAAGPDVFLLGCCVSQNMRSFGGSFGLLDAMRVGPDTGAGHIGAPHASRNYFLHGRVWQNDPDCVSVRARTPLDQARVNASFTAIAGHLFYNSDWMPDLPAERLDILKRTIPAHGLLPRPVDLFENDPARVWLLTDTRRSPRRDVVALFNWDSKKPAMISCAPDRLGLPAAKEYVAFDFWANKFVPPFRGQLSATLPPASCRVLAVRPATAHPQLLSTSRHVTQGMVDVLEEKWDAATRTFSGVSRVVANDPYEMRLVVPVGADSWFIRDVEPPMPFEQDGPRIRATIHSPTGGEIRWRLKFEPMRIEPGPPPPVANLKAAADYDSVTLTWASSRADSYRIVRGDGATFESSAPNFTDTTVAHGKTYRYTVCALGWTGNASESSTIEIATPAELKRPPTPLAPDIHLADLKPLVVQNGWGKLGVNKSVEGKPLTVEGRRYERGLGCHAKSLLVYRIPAGAKRFVAVVGLDDEKKSDPRSSVAFEVCGDVKEMGEAPVLLAKSPVLPVRTIRSWAFNVELNTRFKELRLVITDAGDGIASDHADWVNAGFVMR